MAHISAVGGFVAPDSLEDGEQLVPMTRVRELIAQATTPLSDALHAIATERTRRPDADVEEYVLRSSYTHCCSATVSMDMIQGYIAAALDPVKYNVQNQQHRLETLTGVLSEIINTLAMLQSERDPSSSEHDVARWVASMRGVLYDPIPSTSSVHTHADADEPDAPDAPDAPDSQTPHPQTPHPQALRSQSSSPSTSRPRTPRPRTPARARASSASPRVRLSGRTPSIPRTGRRHSLAHILAAPSSPTPARQYAAAMARAISEAPALPDPTSPPESPRYVLLSPWSPKCTRQPPTLSTVVAGRKRSRDDDKPEASHSSASSSTASDEDGSPELKRRRTT